MRYECDTTLNLPRARVVELFDDPDNLKHWMKGLVSFEPLTGEPGRPGATSRLTFVMNGRPMVLTETVVTRDLPHAFGGTYEMKGTVNSVLNRFEAVAADRTRWVCESEFRCRGFMKVMAVLMPWVFRAQTRAHMAAFKAFAEGRG